MRQAWIVGVVAAAAVGVSLACGDDTTAPGPSDIGVHDDFFSPGAATRSVGVVVSWRWDENNVNTHNIVFEDGESPASDMTNSGTHARTFASAGTYRYRCTNHSADFATGMVGEVIAVQ